MHANLQVEVGNALSAAARRRLLSRRAEPLFLADWERALFIHYEVKAAAFQRDVPFPLDLREGRAYVSLVAFTMRGMRFRFGGKFSEWLCRPIATHEFLNVRTYIRHRGEPGIFFLSEWLSNPLSVRIGPRTFGLPYRFGRIQYQHNFESGVLRGRVASAGTENCLRYEAEIAPDVGFNVCPESSLDEFLLERYTAFTASSSKRRFFRIWHEPWPQVSLNVNVLEDSLIAQTFPWFAGAKFVGANFSPGARDVWMGRPHRVHDGGRNRRSRVFFELT